MPSQAPKQSSRIIANLQIHLNVGISVKSSEALTTASGLHASDAVVRASLDFTLMPTLRWLGNLPTQAV
jgi:hypothetical protein